MKFSTIENNTTPDSSSDFLDTISNSELIKTIEDKIETKYRESYLKLKGGSKISKQELKKLQEHILKIISDQNL